jgi:hypothetical protein
MACQRILVGTSSQSQRPDTVITTTRTSSTTAWARFQRSTRVSCRRFQSRPAVPRIHARRFHRWGPTVPTKTSPTTLWMAMDVGSKSTETTPAAISTRSTAQRSGVIGRARRSLARRCSCRQDGRARPLARQLTGDIGIILR